VLDDLIESCQSHFAHEEEYLANIGSADLNAQRAAHARLAAAAIRVRNLVGSGGSLAGPTALEVAELVESLRAHFHGLDQWV